jgi:antitoxin component YwqK of YwqJK toxin-antitoxin module
MEEYTIPKNWEDLVGSFFDPNNKAAQHLLEYAPDPVIIQILLNIPLEDLEAFCSINKRVRRICKSKLVKKQYYEKNPTLETDSYAKAKAFLKKNPNGLLSITRGNDFTAKNLIELADRIVYLTMDSSAVYDKIIVVMKKFRNLETLRLYYKYSEQLTRDEHYKNSKLDGTATRWFRNGQIQEEKNYKNDKLDGLQKFWYENGQLMEKSNYKNDGLDGPFSAWLENGQLRMKTYFKDGMVSILRNLRYGKLRQKSR